MLREAPYSEGQTAPSQLTVLEQAMKFAREEVLVATKKNNPNWYQAAQMRLDPLVQNRNSKQEAYNKNRNDICKKTELQIARTKLKREVRAAEKAWIDATVANVNGLHRKDNGGDGRQLSPKECWDAVRQLQTGIHKKSVATAFNFKAANGNITNTSEEAAQVMGDYQAGVFSKEGSFDATAIDGVRQRPLRPEMDKPPTFDEYLKAVSGLNNNKAPGDDGNFAELYKALIGDQDTERYLYDVILAFWKSGSYPGDDVVSSAVSKALLEPTFNFAKQNNWNISYLQDNPKTVGSKCHRRYDGYKHATNFREASSMGATAADLKYDLSRGYLRFYDPRIEQSEANEKMQLNVMQRAWCMKNGLWRG